MRNPAIVQSFIKRPTPQRWIEYALNHLDVLLVDQANCEKKAASSAISLMYRVEDHVDFLHRLSRLAREELRHFELVIDVIEANGSGYFKLGPSRYAKHLHAWVRADDSAKRLVDQLVVAAMIEARSCERIGTLIPHLKGSVRDLYTRLHESEGRHFEIYLEFAARQSGLDHVLERLDSLRHLDDDLIYGSDEDFRFHSGVPTT